VRKGENNYNNYNIRLKSVQLQYSVVFLSKHMLLSV